MKFLVLLVIILGALAAAEKFTDGSLSKGLRSKIYSEERTQKSPKKSIPRRQNYQITDTQGRALDCILLAKRENFIQIKRAADGQEFLLPIDKLSEENRQEFANIEDFNEDSMRDLLFERAQREVSVTLLYMSGNQKYRHPQTGQMMMTADGRKLEFYRGLLEKMEIPYREELVETQPAGENLVYLPLGISEVPCLRVGGQTLTCNSKWRFQDIVIDDYLAQLRNPYR